MEVINVSIKKIKPDPNQPRKRFDVDALERLRLSVKDVGVEHPILIRENGSGYTIIDGERRWKVSNELNLKTIPGIVVDTDSALEVQLRSDCLKEGLNVDEKDKAIYLYYQHWNPKTKTIQKEKSVDTSIHPNTFREISRRLGLSKDRVLIAIDRFELKNNDPEFIEEVDKKYNPKSKSSFGTVDSTIAMTRALKDKPKVRKELIKDTLERKKTGISKNAEVKDTIKRLKDLEEDDVDTAKKILKAEKAKDMPDVNVVFKRYVDKYNSLNVDFMSKNFGKVKEHINDSNVLKLMRLFEEVIQDVTGRKFIFKEADSNKDRIKKLT